MPRKKSSPLFSSEEKPSKTPAEKPKEKKKPISAKEKKPTKIPIEKPKEKKKVVSSKRETPKKLPSSPPKKEITLKPRSVKKEDPIEEVKEVKNEIPKRKEIKKVKKEEPKNIKHKLKVGQKVIVTFLGSPTGGTIIDLTSEGTYKVKSDRGIVFPRAKILLEGEIMDRYYPSYIIKVLK